MSRFGNARLGARRDLNEVQIVEVLRAHGCLVERVNGNGVPDLLVWSPKLGRIILLEVKNAERVAKNKSHGRLKEDQQFFHTRWGAVGAPVYVVMTVAEALARAGVA